MLSVSEYREHWQGLRNRVVRYYFYVQRGLALLNEFRYLIMAILAVYALLDMKSPWLMMVMFVVAVPILLVLGWMYTYKMAKTMDFLNVKFSTHYSKYNIELQERQTEALETLCKNILQDESNTSDV